MNILGISAYCHDSAVCLVCNGDIAAAAQEERFTRKKHDSSFPAHAMEYCLFEGGLRAHEIDLVAISDNAQASGNEWSVSSGARSRAERWWERKRRWLKEWAFLPHTVRRSLGYQGAVLRFGSHESFAAAAFLPSPFEQAAILTLDGSGGWSESSFCEGNGNGVQVREVIRNAWPLGIVYDACSRFCGFEGEDRTERFMQLAPYGEPRFADTLKRDWLTFRADGACELKAAPRALLRSDADSCGLLEELVGGSALQPGSEVTRRESDLACSVHVIAGEALSALARHVQQATGARHLCLAGGGDAGLALHSAALREGLFDKVWHQPAMGGAGKALGCALLAWHRSSGRAQPRNAQREQGNCLGPYYTDVSIASYLTELGIEYASYEDDDELCVHVADLLAAGHVVGWFQGRMEYGPWALGARGILADARLPETRSLLNRKMLVCDAYRVPGASVLHEAAREYFDLDGESPSMHRTAHVSPASNGKGALPAITQGDNLARVHTVHESLHGRYYRLLKAFEGRTGCPVVAIDRFSTSGEPSVCTPQDAYACFMRTYMDYLVLGNCVIDKKKQPPAPIEDSRSVASLQG